MTKKERLEQLENKTLAAYYADSLLRGSEPHIDYYIKNARCFKLLLKSELLTNLSMRKYFKEMSVRLADAVNWNKYQTEKASFLQTKTFKAGILDYVVNAFWENETLVLKVFLTKALVDALEGGGLFTEDELKISVGWSRESAPAIEFLNKYGLSLSKTLTGTTKDKVLAALEMSISNGEDRNQAVDRLMDVINDKVRATTIAQTESVNAFSAGRMDVGRQIGADRKKWRTAGDKKVSAICRNNEALGVVPIDYKYKDFQGNDIDRPAAHPNCRSGIQLFMPGEKV